MLFLTATPHSGDEDAFDRLLGLLHPDFALGPQGGDHNARERYARGLARHFVQRRRPDIQGGGWSEISTFPRHLEREAAFVLAGDWAALQEDVLDYCLGVTERAGSDAQRRRLAFWGTLALMRCVGSQASHAADYLAALQPSSSLNLREEGCRLAHNPATQPLAPAETNA